MRVSFGEKRVVISGASDSDRKKIESFFNELYKEAESVSYVINVHEEHGSGMTFRRTVNFRLSKESKTEKAALVIWV